MFDVKRRRAESRRRPCHLRCHAPATRLGAVDVGSTGRPPRPPVERVPRVALERRGQPRSEQPRPGDGPLAVPAPERRPPPRRPAAAAARRLEQRQLLALAEVRGGHAEQPDPDAPDLRPRQLEGGPEDRLGQVGRLGQRPLAGDRPEARVADLDRTVAARTPAERSRPATPSAIARSVRSIDLRVARVDVERVLVADRLGRVALVDRVGVDSRGRARPATPRACRTGARAGPAAAPRGRRSSAPRIRPGPWRSSRRRPTAARSAAAPGTPPPRPAATTTRPSGLRRSDAILATSLVRRDADRRRQAHLGPDVVLDLAGRSPGRRRTAPPTRSRRGTPRRSRSARPAA